MVETPPSSIDLSPHPRSKTTSFSAKTLKGFLSRKEFLQMNQRHFLLLLFIILMASYLLYRYLNHFFSRKTRVDELVSQYETQQDEERRRMENIIRLNLQQDRADKTTLQLDVVRLTQRSQIIETNIEELRTMLNEESSENESSPEVNNDSRVQSQ